MKSKKCYVEGCRKKCQGYIDMALGEEKDSSWNRIWLCDKHYLVINSYIVEKIKEERVEGKLKDDEDYFICPFHIGKKFFVKEG